MSLLETLLGNGTKDRETAQEMRVILHEMQQERSRYELLLESVRAAVERLSHLGAPIAKAGSDVDVVSSRLREIEQRFEALARLSAQYETLDGRAESLTQDQQRAEAHVTKIVEDAQRIHAAFGELSQRVEQAMTLKDKLAAFLEIEKPFQQLRGDADALRGQLDGTGEHMVRLREQHDRLLDAQKLAMSKMEALDRRREEMGRGLQDKERRVAGVEESVRRMDGVQTKVDEVMREIGTLKALGDTVAQKTAAMEAQRDAVERALARAEDLDRAMRQIDAGVRQQQENERNLAALESQVVALRGLHEAVVDRSREVTQLQRESGEGVQTARQELASMREEITASAERFDFESRGLESVSQRVADLRGALSEFENRFKGVSESAQHVGELKSQAHALSSQLQSLGAEVGHVDEEVMKLKAMRRDVEEIVRSAREAGARVAEIEEARPALEAALRDFEHLGSTHARIKDALEQTEMAHTEINRVRESQTETQSWLAGVGNSLEELKTQVAELRKLAPTVEAVQKQAQRIEESTSAVEARREFIEDLHQRLAEAGALGAKLDERGRHLEGRMESAEQRFAGLASHADEAERISRTIGNVSASLHEAERETGEIVRSISAIEARCESVEGLAERTRALRQELEQRHHALEEASRDLQHASEMRQEAAASAQQLDGLVKRLTASVQAADRRVTRVDALSMQVEDRAGNLDTVDQRLALFEERLAKWNLVEQDVARSLEQISARQGTVEALQADLDRMFVMAEKTAADVRSITSAHREIEESRGLLRDVMTRLGEVRDTASAIDERKRQMTKAEERLSRADALLVEVRSSLEALQSQKVIVDQAVEKAGSLRFLLKQAETMIDVLREEREMTARVRSAVDIVRKGEAASDGADSAHAA